MLTRKKLHDWIEMCWVVPSRIQHGKLMSVYTTLSPKRERMHVVAVQKRRALSDYTRERKREETGINAGLWQHIKTAKSPCRLAIVYDGEVWLHVAEDIRQWPAPEIRYVHGQQYHDPTGVAWWPLSDFRQATHGLPEDDCLSEPLASEEDLEEAEPTAGEDQPDILELLG